MGVIPSAAFDTGKLLAKHFHGCDSTIQGRDHGLARLVAHLQSIGRWGSSDDPLYLAQQALLENPKDRRAQSTVMHWEFTGSWGALGCPSVRVESDWASQVCCSTIPAELWDVILPPWDSFILDVPPELGLRIWINRRSEPMSYVKVGRRLGSVRSALTGDLVDGWFISPGAPNGDEPGSMLLIRSDQLFAGIECDENVPRECFRSLQLVGPLIGAICMAFANGDRRRVGSLKKKSRHRRGGLYPTNQEYVVGKPVQIDLSGRVCDYISHGGKTGSKLQIQGVVRGHWKNQPCGVGRSDRKFIHIEPYWRGPEDAPIAVRPHVLKEGGRA